MNKTVKTLSNYWMAILATLIAAAVLALQYSPWTILAIIVPAVFWLISSLQREAAIQDEQQQAKNEQHKFSSRELDALQQQLSSLTQSELESAREEIAAVNTQVSTAVQKLNTSFHGLNDNTRQQEQVLLSLIERMTLTNMGSDDGEVEFQSLEEFAGEMSKIIEYFIAQVLATSQESMTMVHKIDDMAAKMGEVEALVGDVRTIADQTNLLALNAAIEAARAGEAGRGFAVVADEVRKLSQNSNDFSDQISEVVDTALANIDEAKEIVGKMASKDMSMAIDSKARVDRMLAEVNNLSEFLSDKLGEASGVTESITENVNLAVMSLQFEDMAAQLMRHVEKRLMLLHEVNQQGWQKLCGLKDSDTRNGQPIDREIAALKQDLQQMSDRFESLMHKPVDTAGEEQGGVDLF